MYRSYVCRYLTFSSPFKAIAETVGARPLIRESLWQRFLAVVAPSSSTSKAEDREAAIRPVCVIRSYTPPTWLCLPVTMVGKWVMVSTRFRSARSRYQVKT